MIFKTRKHSRSAAGEPLPNPSTAGRVAAIASSTRFAGGIRLWPLVAGPRTDDGRGARGNPIVRPFVENLRIFHEHALALAAAYALRDGIDIVQWNRNRRHSWA